MEKGEGGWNEAIVPLDEAGMAHADEIVKNTDAKRAEKGEKPLAYEKTKEEEERERWARVLGPGKKK